MEVFEHVGGGDTQSGESCETSGVDDGFGDASFTESGSSQTKDVSMFFDEPTVEQFFNDSGVKLGTGVEVETIDAFDRAEMRAFEASFESSGL
jgi:hypothetical protein